MKGKGSFYFFWRLYFSRPSLGASEMTQVPVFLLRWKSRLSFRMACRDVRSGVLPPFPSQSSDDSLGPNGKVECPFFLDVMGYNSPWLCS